jgi:tetratricopeptide (TPR) repeat protein
MLYSTWQLSFDHVKQQNELSVKLLQLWAYFDNQDVWFELLRHSDSEDPEWIRELTQDEMSFNRAVRVLCDYGLVEAETSSQEWIESNGYSMHGCVHSWTIDVLNQEGNDNLARLAVKFVASHVPAKEADRWWLVQRRLLQHVARCLYFISNGKVADCGIEGACHNLALLYASQGKLKEAGEMYRRALQGKEKALGSDHTSTLMTVNNLGNLYADQGKLKEAEEMYQRALQGMEEALGPDHTSTLETVNNLGILYTKQGKLKEAEEMYQRALQGYEKRLGSYHSATLTTVSNLGILYADQGKLKEAEEMFQRALQGREEALGPDHTSTLQTVNNLGLLHANQGKLKEAEEMYQRALQGMEEALGPDHTSTLMTVNNLGLLYKDQGKLKEAEEMYQQALQGYEKALGREQLKHYLPALNTMQSYGVLLADSGSLDQAEELLRQALSGLAEILGHSSQRCQLITARINTLRPLVAPGRQDGSKKRRWLKFSRIFKST